MCEVYREWAYLKTVGYPNENSGTILEQERRSSLFLDSWEDALDQVEDVSVVGDMNIDLGKVFKRRNYPCRKMADETRIASEAEERSNLLKNIQGLLQMESPVYYITSI